MKGGDRRPGSGLEHSHSPQPYLARQTELGSNGIFRERFSRFLEIFPYGDAHNCDGGRLRDAAAGLWALF